MSENQSDDARRQGDGGASVSEELDWQAMMAAMHEPPADAVAEVNDTGEYVGVTPQPPAPSVRMDGSGVDGELMPWHPHPPIIGTLPPPSNPMAVARELMPEWTEGGWLTLRSWQGAWLRWKGSHWAELTEAELVANLYHVVEHAEYNSARQGVVPWAPTSGRVLDLLKAVKALTLTDPEVTEPSWLSRVGAPVMEGPVLACENGLLDTVSGRLWPHSPMYFNSVAVPFAFNREAGEPVEWLKFLDSVWGDDPGAVATLQEWMGYLLSGRTDLQKMLLIVGPPRSGKGTIGRVMRRLIGEANTAAPTMASMGTNFGLSSLIGKSLAIIPDARVPKKDTETVIERFLAITGEDTIDVDRKHKDLWTGKLNVRFVTMSNSLPEFADASNAINSRYVVLMMTTSHLGREDTRLEGRLMAEMPAILNWALKGLERLTARGHLLTPGSSGDAVDMMNEASSPMQVFIDENCVVGDGESVPCADLRASYKWWCELQGRHPVADNRVGRELLACVAKLHRKKSSNFDAAGNRPMLYVGVGLKPNAVRPPANRV